MHRGPQEPTADLQDLPSASGVHGAGCVQPDEAVTMPALTRYLSSMDASSAWSAAMT